MVRDRFICGMRSEKLRAFLISDDTIDSAAVALQKAVARENSYNDAHQMNSVNAVKFKRTLYSKTFQNNGSSSSSHGHANSSTSITCSKCTIRGHSAKDCKVRCRFCRKPGHIKANCHKLKKVNNVQGDGDGNGNYDYGDDVGVDGDVSVNVVRDEDQPFDYTFHVAKICRESSVLMCNSLNSNS